jgi:hypothetical protein
MKKMRRWSYVLLALLLLTFYSCQEETLPAREETPEEAAKPDVDFTAARSSCSIDGATIGCTGQSSNFTFTTDVPTPYTLTWSVVSGNITLTSGQGTATATFSFAGNFTGGVIRCDADGEFDCEDSFNISAASVASAPTIELIDIEDKPHLPDRYTFEATYIAGATYQWYKDGVLQMETSNTYTTGIVCGTTKYIKCKTVNGCGASSFSNEIEQEADSCPED